MAGEEAAKGAALDSSFALEADDEGVVVGAALDDESWFVAVCEGYSAPCAFEFGVRINVVEGFVAGHFAVGIRVVSEEAGGVCAAELEFGLNVVFGEL